MEILIIITTVIGGVVGLVQLIKWLKKSGRPYVDVQLRFEGGQSIPLGISPRARPNPGENFFRADESLHCYELRKKISIILINNSEVAALYPKLYIHNDSFKPVVAKFNNLVPLKAHETIFLQAEYSEIEEKLPKHRTQLENFPSEVLRKNLKMIVEYQDSQRKKYYSMLDGSNNQTKYVRKIAKGFESLAI